MAASFKLAGELTLPEDQFTRGLGKADDALKEFFRGAAAGAAGFLAAQVLTAEQIAALPTPELEALESKLADDCHELLKQAHAKLRLSKAIMLFLEVRRRNETKSEV